MSAKLKTGGDAKAMRTTKFPDEFNKKVDMAKVNIPVIKKWVSDEVAKILQSDDDVVPEMIFEELKAKSPNIKKLQIDISGFLDKDTPAFCLELWRLLISAQDDPNGIPRQLIEAKKLKLIEDRVEEDKQRAAAEQRRQDERERDFEMAQRREYDRRDRDREYGRGRGRGGGGRYPDRRPPPRDSRSPPPPRRRNGDDFYRAPPRNADTYIPSGRARRGDRSPPARRRSPSYDRSRSRSPRPEAARGKSPTGRRGDRGHRRDNYRYRSRTPPRRRRDSSPFSADDRHSPERRRRRLTPPRNRSPRPGHGPSRGGGGARRRRSESHSPSRSPPRRRPGSSHLGHGDLMSRTDRRKDTYRLERPGSSGGDSSRVDTPPKRRNSSSVEVDDNKPPPKRRNSSSVDMTDDNNHPGRGPHAAEVAQEKI